MAGFKRGSRILLVTSASRLVDIALVIRQLKKVLREWQFFAGLEFVQEEILTEWVTEMVVKVRDLAFVTWYGWEEKKYRMPNILYYCFC